MKATRREFKLLIEAGEFRSLLDCYLKNERQMNRERDAFAAGELIQAGHLTRERLLTIVHWKSHRSKGLIEDNSECAIRDALHLAKIAKTGRAAVAVLTGLQGVKVPVASAILTTMFPQRFTVIDIFALTALGNPNAIPTINLYLDYRDFCHETSTAYGYSLRQFDQILWQGGKKLVKKESLG